MYVPQEVITVDRAWNLQTATGLSESSCLVAKGMTEGGAADGSAGALAHCAGTAHPCDMVALAFYLDSTVVTLMTEMRLFNTHKKSTRNQMNGKQNMYLCLHTYTYTMNINQLK